MIKKLYTITILVTSFALHAMQKTPVPITHESYFNKTLREIKIFDHSLNKALSDSNWNFAYMSFVSYFKKPSMDRIQNMYKSFLIIQSRINMVEYLLIEKQNELFKYLQPSQPTRRGGFDLFDTKDVMNLVTTVAVAPWFIIGSIIDAYNIGSLKNGIKKAKQVLDTLTIYKESLEKYLKPYQPINIM